MASESSRLPKLAERRQIQRTDLTSTSSRAASLEAALRENLILEQRLEAAAAGVTPQDSLRRLLSLKSIVSTSSSFAERHQAAVGTEAPFREIGTGSIGKVFEHPGTVWAYKLPLGDDASKLWNNYIINRMIEASFEQLGLLAGQAEVPRAVWYATPATNEFWDLNIDRFPYTTEFQRRPRAALCTERIFPLPAPIREALISLYCPQHAQESAKMYPANKDCLVRPLLGRRRHSTTSKLNSFSLRNFKLHLDQVEEIQLDVQEIAFAMADALAVLHWHTKIDALDIEFVLGSSPQEDQKIRRGIPLEKLTGLQTPQSTFEHVTNSHPNFRRRVTSLWLLDFDACSDISMDQAGVDKACRAFMETDPYFPRPQPGRDAAAGQLWTSFGQRYLATAAEFISAEHKALPERFLVVLRGMQGHWVTSQAIPGVEALNQVQAILVAMVVQGFCVAPQRLVQKVKPVVALFIMNRGEDEVTVVTLAANVVGEEGLLMQAALVEDHKDLVTAAAKGVKGVEGGYMRCGGDEMKNWKY